ncbi:integral membrane protein [Colletotrichum falcatum]|nr:integral membrane protein [Colletotrichum falcatum]
MGLGRFGVCGIIHLHFGDGLHKDTLSRERYFKTQEAFPTIKATFLLQYRRTFPLPMFRTLCNVFIVFIAAFGIAQVVSVSFVCIPLRSLWDATVPGHCFKRLPWWYAGSSISLVTDVMIVVMPMPLLRTIRLPPRQKVVLMGTFALGFFTCAISIVRISILRSSSTLVDATYDTVIAGVWSITELTCAIICVCVPTLRPILIRQNSKPESPSWLWTKFGYSGNSNVLDHSDGRVLSLKRRPRPRPRLQQAADQADVEPAQNSGFGPRPRLRMDVDDIPSLPLPPSAYLTPDWDSTLDGSPWKNTMVPLARFDTEEGVGFLNSDMPEPEQPTPLKPPPRRHTGIPSGPEEDEYFGAVVWNSSGQPGGAGSSGFV